MLRRKARLLAMAIVVVAFLVPLRATAQPSSGWPIDARAALPGRFAIATGTQALRLIFPDYRETDGTSRSVPDFKRQATHVGFEAVSPWNAGTKHHLVALIGAGDDGERYGLNNICDVCGERILLVIFDVDGSRLHVVARSGPALENALYSEGGRIRTTLDLAPYHLTTNETLLGLHDTVTVNGIFSQRLVLLRLAGNALVRVADSVNVFEGDTQHRISRVTTISSVPGTGGYDDLRAVSQDESCADGNGYSSPVSCHDIRPANRSVRTYRFDGTSYTGAMFPERK